MRAGQTTQSSNCGLALHRWPNRRRDDSRLDSAKKDLAKLESTAARRLGASQGKHGHRQVDHR
jgi:hypothetical protein